jgi:hypothetical protein
LAKALADKHAPVVFSLPRELATPQDVIVTWVHAVCRRRQGRRGPVPTVRLGCRTDKPDRAAEGKITSAPFAVLGTVILCPGVTRDEVAATQPYIMEAIGGKVPGRREGRVEELCRASVQHWLVEPRQREQHGYTIDEEDGRCRYRHERPPA